MIDRATSRLALSRVAVLVAGCSVAAPRALARERDDDLVLGLRRQRSRHGRQRAGVGAVGRRASTTPRTRAIKPDAGLRSRRRTPPTYGAQAKWSTVTPPSIFDRRGQHPAQVGAHRSECSDGFNASFFFNGGSQTIYPTTNCCGGMYYGTGINRFIAEQPLLRLVRDLQSESHAAARTRSSPSTASNSSPSTTPRRPSSPIGPNNIWSTASEWIRGVGLAGELHRER